MFTGLAIVGAVGAALFVAVAVALAAFLNRR